MEIKKTSSTSATSLFCHSWCCLCVHLLQTWYLFCEVAAAETKVLVVVHEKPKEGVKIENVVMLI